MHGNGSESGRQLHLPRAHHRFFSSSSSSSSFLGKRVSICYQQENRWQHLALLNWKERDFFLLFCNFFDKYFYEYFITTHYLVECMQGARVEFQHPSLKVSISFYPSLLFSCLSAFCKNKKMKILFNPLIQDSILLSTVINLKGARNGRI